MPTVLKRDAFEIRIYTDDHAPAHVHVWRAGEELIVDLGGENTAPTIRENNDMKAKNERRGFILVVTNQTFLLAEWKQIHG